MDIDCIIPAAGESTRMGRWKLLLPFGSETVVERCVRNALLVCSRVILVTGYRGAELSAKFSDNRLVIATHNPDFSTGMFSSIKAGARIVSTSRFFVALADMPLLPPSVYRQLVDLPGLDSASAARPYCAGRKGHPVLLPSAAIDKILQLDNSHTMSDVLSGMTMVRLSTDETGTVSDIDTPDDYRRLDPSP